MSHIKTDHKIATDVFCLIVFIIIFLLLLYGLNDITRHKTGGEIDMVHSIFEEEDDSLDLICLGPSHAYNSYLPMLIWEEYGIPSALAASPSQTMFDAYYILQEILKHQKPKVVLIEAFSFTYKDYYTSEGKLRTVTDGLPFGRTRDEMISAATGDSAWDAKASWYLPFIKYHTRWNDLNDYDFNQSHFLRGASIITTSVPCRKGQEVTVPVEIPERAVAYFEKIRELCTENDIELFVYQAPFNQIEDKAERYERLMGIMLSVKAYMEKEGIPFYSFQDNDELDLDMTKDFCTDEHMNIYGAEKLTRLLGDHLASHYDLPSHKKEARYADWNKDLKDYHAYLDKIKRSGNNTDPESSDV